MIVLVLAADLVVTLMGNVNQDKEKLLITVLLTAEILRAAMPSQVLAIQDLMMSLS